VLGDYDASRVYLEEALHSFRTLSARDGLAHALLSLSGLLSSRGDWLAGVAAAEEAAQLAQDIDSTSGLAIAAFYVGENGTADGHLGFRPSEALPWLAS
jgi:hypothetical protein